MSGWSGVRAEIPGILGLSIQIVVGLGALTLLGVTDSLMLAPLGPVPLAAVGLTMAVAIIFYAAIYGMLQDLGAGAAARVGFSGGGSWVACGGNGGFGRGVALVGAGAQYGAVAVA